MIVVIGNILKAIAHCLTECCRVAARIRRLGRNAVMRSCVLGRILLEQFVRRIRAELPCDQRVGVGTAIHVQRIVQSFELTLKCRIANLDEFLAQHPENNGRIRTSFAVF